MECWTTIHVNVCICVVDQNEESEEEKQKKLTREKAKQEFFVAIHQEGLYAIKHHVFYLKVMQQNSLTLSLAAYQ